MDRPVIVDIVIVNWNTGKLLRDCLQTLCADKYVQERAQIIVIDNNSQDDSFEAAEGFGELVKLHRMSENLGFARACNRGAELGESRFLLFLNPDTEVPEDAVRRSLESLQSMSEVGVLGIRLLGEDQLVQRSCARFPSLRNLLGSMIGMEHWWPGFHSLIMQEWAHDANRVVDHVIGAYYLLRRDLFEQLSGFDERYFVYLEDIDLSRRVYDSGYNVYYLADVEAYHLGGGSSDQIRDKRLYYSIESRFLFAMKHLGWVKGVTVISASLFIEMPVRAVRALLSGKPGDVVHVLRATMWLARSLPSVLSGRHNARLKGINAS